MGMLLRRRPSTAPASNDAFYKKAEQAFKEQQAKEQAETTDKEKPVRGRKRKTE